VLFVHSFASRYIGPLYTALNCLSTARLGRHWCRMMCDVETLILDEARLPACLQSGWVATDILHSWLPFLPGCQYPILY